MMENVFIKLSGVRLLFPGILIAGLIALAAQFISDHYGAPAMLMALLFGISLNFLSNDPKCKLGIIFCSRLILRFGIALLGMRISFDMAADLGWSYCIYSNWRRHRHNLIWFTNSSSVWPRPTVRVSICRICCDLRCICCHGNFGNITS